jgi:predicted dehydrogenase
VPFLKQVNLGIIGIGNQGKVSLFNSLRLKETKVLGAADLSQKALRYAKNRGVKNVYADYEDLLKNDGIDGVVVNLPNFLHLEAAVKAAEAGKHILLEKPLARNVEEGEKILSAVRRNGVKLMIGYVLRFNPVLRKVHDEIADGLFGSVQIVEATNVSGGPFSPKNDSVGPVQVPSWWFDKELSGGGVLLDLGSHMIDLLGWYFGEVVYVKSYMEHLFKNDLEDVATCLLKFKDGPIATVKVGWFSKAFLQSLQVCGTAKNMLVRISPQTALQTIWKGIATKFGLTESGAYYLQLKHFVECLQKDKEPEPSGEEGLRSLQVISRAYENTLNTTKKWE